MTSCRDCGAEVVDGASPILAMAPSVAKRIGEPVVLCLRCYRRFRDPAPPVVVAWPPPYQDREPGEDG